MNLSFQNTLLGIGSLGLLASGCSGLNKETSKPNIVFILADDLGYGDLGCYGQTKIETPNIDQLATTGMLFTDHYAGSAVCAPSRSVLLTGVHSGKGQVRGNDPWPERGDVQNYRAMFRDSTLEGSRPIEANTYTTARMLQSAGYKTGIVGKWGLGAPGTAGLPNLQGFDFFYGYICQRQAHTHYPLHLWKNDRRVFLDNDTVAPHEPFPEGVDPYNLKASYKLNDYAPDLMFKEITQFVDENKANPFFLYWATTIPHLPLQAPESWIEYYVKKFGDEEASDGGGYFPVRYPKATYAAMISYLDDQVGKLVQQLKDLGIYENTLIIFTSDNGPYGSFAPWFKSAGPFRDSGPYIKGSLHEGGIREPMIAAWPAAIKPGTVTSHISGFQDVMPTLAEIAGVELPQDLGGISYLPTLLGKEQKQHEYLYWEYPGGKGQLNVRIGKYKVFRDNVKSANPSPWQVYDLETDPLEENDLAASNPDLIQRAEEIIALEHTPSFNKNWQFQSLLE
jgi:arylsulfatase